MPGQFLRIGNTVFPGGGDIPCGLYEWRSTTPEKQGSFVVRFVSPDGDAGPRRYWVQPLLGAWMEEGDGTRFLEEACDYGYKIVAELNHHCPEQQQAYQLASRLFRSRLSGHMAVKREFMCAADFIDLSRPTDPSLITPGIGADQTDLQWDGSDVNGTATRLLQEAFTALREDGMGDLPAVHANIHGVLEVYQRFVKHADRSRQKNPLPLFQVEDTEVLFIQQFLATIDPPPDFPRIENAVAGSLVYGTTVLQEDQAAVAANPEEWQYLVTQLAKKSSKQGITPDEFDSWFKRVQEDGYLQLIEGGRQLSHDARRDAKELAAQMMRALMWWVYRSMSHCYGVLMFLIAMDLQESEPKPSPLEVWIFRLEHCQMDFLAGLPLDFLGRAQLRWIIRVWQRTLTEISHPDLVERFNRGDFSFDTYLQFPKLLGIFATLARERRDADTRTKDQSSGETEELDAMAAPPDEDSEDYIRRKGEHLTTHPEYIKDCREEAPDEEIARTDVAAPINLTSNLCPICGTAIQCNADINVSDPTQGCFWGYCRRCDTVKYCVVKLQTTDRLVQ